MDTLANCLMSWSLVPGRDLEISRVTLAGGVDWRRLAGLFGDVVGGIPGVLCLAGRGDGGRRGAARASQLVDGVHGREKMYIT